MVTSDQLLQFIAHLRQDTTLAHGRRMLLNYIRKSSGAQVVALFTLNKERCALVPSIDHQQRLLRSDPASHQKRLQAIPLNGLFGSALLTQGLLSFPNLSTDQRALPEERAWGWLGGHVVISSILPCNQQNKEQGIVVLCFPPETGKGRKIRRNSNLPRVGYEDDLLVCTILLSAYLSGQDHKVHSDGTSPSRIPVSQQSVQQVETTTPLQPDHSTQQASMLPDMMSGLSCLSELHEISLAIGPNMELHELHQQILTHLRRVICAPDAYLLLYQPFQQQFFLSASQGEELSSTLLSTALHNIKVEQLAMRDSGERLTTIQTGTKHLLLVTLDWRDTLFGIVILSLPDKSKLSHECCLLLTHLGNGAALLLHKYDWYVAQQQATINQERSRIARDIHDGPAQHMTHALHKLELIQHSLEKQHLHFAISEVKQTYSILQTSLNELRHSLSSLVPVQIEQQGLVVALQDLLHEYMLHHPKVEITSNIDDLHLLPSTLEVPIFRFIQESLNNIRKHAYATHITLQVSILTGLLLVEISDNGIGFQPELVINQPIEHATTEHAMHLGLRTMRERIQEVGGSWEVQSHPGKGTIVKARFPLTSPNARLTNRERDVLRCIVEGLSNRDIAEQLMISLETVKTHVHHIMQKMQVKDRTQAAVLATKHGWL